MTTPATVAAPASKSVSHRAFIAAALAEGTSVVTHALESVDLARTRHCLTQMGANFTKTEAGWSVSGVAGTVRPVADPADLDVHESGTTCRLLTGVAAAGEGRFRVHGAPRMHLRPIGQLTGVLETLGASFEWEGEPGFPPFVMTARGLPGGQSVVPMEESSQYLSGLLLASPLARAESLVAVGGKKVVSWPYVALTLMVMADFGAPVVVETLGSDGWVVADYATASAAPGGLRFRVKPARYKARTYRVEGDWSNASYFLAAGALGPRPVRVEGLRRDSLQGDKAILDILASMGAAIDWEDGAVTVSGHGLRGVELDMGSCPDLVPTVAMTAALSGGTTVIRNVAHLRIKESDRLEACAAEARRLGAKAETFADGICVTGASAPPPRRVEFLTYGDHRLAMSTQLATLKGVEAVHDDPGCVSKSFPDFFDVWRTIR
ncbi:3-phosphoshikimate 1-carboxyvinyltransferase [Fundidesulfovibrio butyratiphilus]